MRLVHFRKERPAQFEPAWHLLPSPPIFSLCTAQQTAVTLVSPSLEQGWARSKPSNPIVIKRLQLQGLPRSSGQTAMSLRSRPQLPPTASMRLRTDHKSLKASTSTASSATPSPTQSTIDTAASIELSTSVSDPDDYADSSAGQPASSTKMRTKSTTRDPDPVNETVDAGNRRASARVRKPTAKAQALNGNKSYSPPLEDIIVIGSPSPSEDRARHDQHSKASPQLEKEPQEAPQQPQIPESPAKPAVNGTITPPETEATKDETAITTAESPSRRTSQRERKPSAKLLSETIPSQKRPAPESRDAPPRKSARISYSGAKVPSKLRYSVSSANSEADDAERVEIPQTPASKKPQAAEIPETSSSQKSKVIVLKSKRLSEVTSPNQTSPMRPLASTASSPTAKRRSKRRSKRMKATTETPQPPAQPTSTEIPGSCNLFCLSPSSRLLAFAEIARQMPDSDDEDEDVVAGSSQDWRSYTQLFCRCDKDLHFQTNRANSVELARALMPNTVSQDTRYDPVDLSTSGTPEAELLSTPVNTIIKATDAERLSQLYAGPNSHVQGRTPNGAPAAGTSQSRDGLGAPPHPWSLQRRVSISEGPTQASYAMPFTNPAKRTYEDRLRDDHKALTDIRKRAAARGIPWSFNMTFDDIHALIMDLEDQEQGVHPHQQATSPLQVMSGRGHDAREPHHSPMGFGVLLPPRASSHRQSSRSNHQRRKDKGIANPLTNGLSGGPHDESNPSNISFVGEGDLSNPPSRRRSSLSRPKSSRFRVDPRGLRGESPGPGTIINMEKMRKQQMLKSAEKFRERAAGLDRAASTMAQMRGTPARAKSMKENGENPV